MNRSIPVAARIALLILASTAAALPAAAQMDFHTIVPCRVYDSRGGDGPLDMWDGVPANEAAATYTVAITGACGVPANAVGVFVNVTIMGATKDGYLQVFPTGTVRPAGSPPEDALSFRQGRTIGKFELARLGTGVDSGKLSFLATVQPIPPPAGARQYQITLDVSGYYLNGLPIAVNDSYDTDIDTTLNVNAASGVTANDTLNGSAIVSYGVNGTEQTTLGTATPTAQSGTITLNADGSFTYVPPSATFGGDDTFKYILQNGTGSSTATVTISVNQLDQTISFTSTPPAGATVGSPTYTVTATATSGLPVTFTIDPSASTVCSISGSTVSFIGVGTCKINADQAGDATYNAAPQEQQSFPVGQGSQTISFTSTAPVGATVGGPTYTVTATASPSGLPVTFTIDASASTVCSIAGSTVSFIGVGTCVINANQAGDANYSAAPQVQQSFPVGQGSQTISFTSTAPVGATVGGPTYTVTATATSGLPVTFTIDASASSVCSIAGSTVSFIGVGTCVINANQAGNANYSAAPQVQQSFPVGQSSQTISFTSTAPVGATVGGPTYTVTATATSGLPVTLTIDASASSVCSIAGSTVSFIGVGTCVINANQPGDANYSAAPQVQQSFPVAKGDQTISFTSTAPVGAKVGDPTYTVTATASPSGLPVTFTIDASASSVCSIVGSTVSFIGVGTCVINANQAGDANYNPAPQVQQSFAVAKGDQTISFTSTAPVGAKVGGPTYTVTATASPSGLPVTFTIDASASSVCSIVGSTVSFIGAGTCVINANQAGNANYNAAPQVQQSFAVAKGDQTISFTSTAPVGAKVGGPTYTVTATATSGLPVTFTIDASASSVCSIVGSTVSFIGAGTCVINANQAGNANYNPAPQVQQSFAVAKGDQTISFTSTAPTNAKVGGPTYTVTATASPSGLPVTFTIDASASTVCSIAGSTVSFIGAGICVINANQPGNASYNAAPQVQQSFQVYQSPQITSANSTSFTAGLPGTFTVTTIGFPTNASMSITESGALPSGVTFTNNNNGTATLAGTPAAGTQTGSPYGITITADNGIAPAAVQTFTLNILNTPPQPRVSPPPLETFDTIGNTAFEFKSAQSLTPGVWVSGNLVNNFTDINGPNAITAFGIVGCADVSAPFVCATANGGSVTLELNGEFTFTPKAGDTVASDSFQYQVWDGMDPSAARTVTINRRERVWYVRNNATAGGLGRSTDPFDTLVEAQNASSVNDYIFVYLGDGATTGQAAGITLKAGQHLLGEHAGLLIRFSPAITFNGAPGTASWSLHSGTAGSRPLIDNPGGNAVSASEVLPAEIAGLSLSGSVNAIDLTTTAVFTGSGTLEIKNNVIRSAGAEGFDVNLGGTGTVTLAVTGNSWTGAAAAHVGNAVDIARTNGSLLLDFSSNTNIISANAAGAAVNINGGALANTTVTGFSGNAVPAGTAGAGILVSNATFDQTPGSTFQTVSGGATTIGGAGTAGMMLSNVAGDLSFSSLQIVAGGGVGLQASGTTPYTGSAGFQITLANNAPTKSVTATGGPAVSLSTVAANLPSQTPVATQMTVTSTNSSTTGVALNSVTGVFSAGSGSSITGSTGTGFQVGSSSANVTYDGTITTTAGKGVDLTSNSGSIAFSGVLTLSSGGNTAFNATGGGTVTATNTGSTLTSSTGTALNVANTTIGAGGLKFRSISAGTAGSGPTNGIVLNNTGSSGSLTVSGTGSAGTGGTIRKAGTGISLTSTQSPSFSWMQLNDFTDFAIRGASVVNFTLANSVINGTNGDNAGADEGSVRFTELTGSASITNCNISGGVENNFTVINTAGTLNRITFTSTTFGANSTASGDDGLLIEGQNAAVVNTTVQNSFFTSARGDHFQLNLIGTASADLVFTGNTISNSHPAVVSGGGGIRLTGGSSGSNTTATYNFSNNTIRDSNGTAIGVTKGAGNGTFTGTIDNNQIGVAAVTNSGSSAGSGISVILAEGGSHTTTVTNNQIRQYNNFGIIIQTGGTATVGSGTMKATVTGNTISNPGNMVFAKNGFQLNSGTLPGETYQVCLSFGGAGALRNSLVGSGTDGGTDFRLRQRQSTTVRLPGYGGANNDDAAVVAFAQTNNNLGGTPSGSATNTVPTGGGWIGGACP